MGLTRAAARIGALLTQTPILFVTAVVAIAVVFRVGIGMLRAPAEAEAEAEPPALHEAPQSATRPSAPAIADDGRKSADVPPLPPPESGKRGKRGHPRSHGRR